MKDLKKTIAFALLTTLAANFVLASTPPPGEVEQPEKLFGAQVVIDPEHILTTLQQIAIDKATRALAERALNRLVAIPFSDSRNYTGAFLANMEWIFSGVDSTLPTIGFVHEDLGRLLEEIFPSWEHFERRTSELLGEINSAADWERMIYLVRKEEHQRILQILHEHSSQLSRERQALLVQRLVHDVSDGDVEHLQLISAGIQQLADAQSVERQLEMLRLNTEIVDRLEERAREAQHRATVLEILDAWAPENGSVPLMRDHGLTVT